MRTNHDTVEEFWEWRDVENAFLNIGSKSLHKFRHNLGSSIGISSSQVLLMPSGRQALKWILSHLPGERRGVMVSAFNCPVVADAVGESGYQAILYDFSPVPGVFDWEQILEEIHDQIECIIVPHFFGVPTDFRPIIKECARRRITIIEDCAHTLGAKIGGSFVGTLGDASILSFNYDKPISLGWGGAVVANNRDKFPFPGGQDYDVPEPGEEIDALGAFVASMKERRSAIPQVPTTLSRILRAARQIKTKRFFSHAQYGLGAVQAELGLICLSRYQDIAKKRNSNAKIFASNVGLPTWPVAGDIEPCWLKQKVYIKNDLTRRKLCRDLQRRGYRVGNYNWPKIINGANKSRCLNAVEIATRWIDVPIHQHIEADQIFEITETIGRAAS